MSSVVAEGAKEEATKNATSAQCPGGNCEILGVVRESKRTIAEVNAPVLPVM